MNFLLYVWTAQPFLLSIEHCDFFKLVLEPSKANTSLLSTFDREAMINPTIYISIVGELQYLPQMQWLDITYIVNKLS